MGRKIVASLLLGTIMIIVSFTSATSVNIIHTHLFSQSISATNNFHTINSCDDYEKLFDEKETIHVVPLNNFRTQLLTLFRRSWESRTFIFQNKTVSPIENETVANFSYWAKPVFQLGLPDQRFATQVTPEGHLFTGSAELVFFTGKNFEAINQRIWKLYKGYLPCIEYQVKKDGLIFNIQAFQYWLEERYDSPAVNFIKVQIINPTAVTKETRFSLGFKYGTLDHRDTSMWLFNLFNPLWKYKMTDEYASRNDELIYLWDTPPSETFQHPGKVYEQPFFCSSRNKTVSLAAYDLSLNKNQTLEYTFKMPLYPFPISNQSFLSVLKTADHKVYLKKMENYWDGLIEQGARIRVAEDKVMNAYKSYLIHCFMCQNNNSDDELEQVVNRFQYNQFWVPISYYVSYMCNLYGYDENSQKILRFVNNYQDDEGGIISQPGYWKQACSALAAFGEYIKITKDTRFAMEVLPTVVKAVEWLKEKILADRFGLVPFANTKDGPFLVGHYTGHNFWALMGLDGAILVAQAAGNKEVVNDFERFFAAYRNHFFQQLRVASERNNGVIPAGMDVEGGVHWEDLLAAYDECLLPRFDSLVNATFDYYRENHMVEGIATHGSFLHHWLTDYITQTAIRREEQERVLHDFYSMLLHTGSCHEGFEYCVHTSTRDYATRASLPLCALIETAPYWCNFPCNGRFATSFNIILRKMLVREDTNCLHLFSVISPEWVKPGNKIIVEEAPTYFGMVNLSAQSSNQGINISFEPHWDQLPESVVLHLPFFAEIESIRVDGNEISFNGSSVELPVDTHDIHITWNIDPLVNYSYLGFVQDYLDAKK